MPLPEAATWITGGEQEAARHGAAVAVADMNGDSFADLLVGAPGWTGDLPHEGRVALYPGGIDGPTATATWTVSSGLDGPSFGVALATCDVNGDRILDVLIGAPYAGTQPGGGEGYTYTETSAGAASLWLGSPGGPAAAAWTVAGPDGAYLGATLACADVNADGYRDALIGSPSEGTGKVRLYAGGPDGLSDAPLWTGSLPDGGGAGFGGGLAAGDVDQDGYDDVVIGAYAGDGRAFLWRGGPDGPGADPSWTAVGEAPVGTFGLAATVGDVDGDGYADVVIGAPGGVGAVRLFPGGPDGPAATASWGADDEAAGTQLGQSLAVADLDGDGYAELIAGAPGAEQVSVFAGGSAGPGARSTRAAGAGFGWDLAAGDVDHDGLADLLVGAPDDTLGASGEGVARLYPGQCARPPCEGEVPDTDPPDDTDLPLTSAPVAEKQGCATAQGGGGLWLLAAFILRRRAAAPGAPRA